MVRIIERLSEMCLYKSIGIRSDLARFRVIGDLRRLARWLDADHAQHRPPNMLLVARSSVWLGLLRRKVKQRIVRKQKRQQERPPK